MTTRNLRPTAQRGRMRVTALIAAGLLLAPAIAGCSMIPVESVVEGVTGGNVDIGGTSVPDDFPAEVPLIDGDVVGAFGVGSGAAKIWTVTKKVGDASAIDTIKADLEGAGFTPQFDQGIGNVAGIAYTNASYGVLVAVTEDGSGGWVATYTVSPAAN